MTKKMISDAVTNLSTQYVEQAADYTVARRRGRPAWTKWAAAAACLCIAAAIPLAHPRASVSDSEPKQALTAAEARTYGPLGELYPEIVPEGYALEDACVGVYDGTVMKAVYVNDTTGDVLTITIAEKDYFGDREYNAVLREGQSGTRIYLEKGDYVAAYAFSTRDIAQVVDFAEMVTSAAAFRTK